MLVIGVAAAMLGAGTVAFFSDTETVGVHDISAGTLNLQVGSDDPCTEHVTINNIKPGWSKMLQWGLRNTGNLDGELWIEISVIINNECGRNEPERAVDNTGGWYDNGELGDYLKTKAAMVDYSDGTGTTTVYTSKTLNDIGGETFTFSGKYGLLEAGETYQLFKMFLELPEGTGDIVQSDSVEFDIIFHLEQA